MEIISVAYPQCSNTKIEKHEIKIHYISDHTAFYSLSAVSQVLYEHSGAKCLCFGLCG